MPALTRARRRSSRLRGALPTLIRRCRPQCSQVNRQSARAKALHHAAVSTISIQNRALQPLEQNLDKMEAAAFPDTVPRFPAAQRSLASVTRASQGTRLALPTRSTVLYRASRTKIRYSQVRGHRHTRVGKIRHQEQAHRT